MLNPLEKFKVAILHMKKPHTLRKKGTETVPLGGLFGCP